MYNIFKGAFIYILMLIAVLYSRNVLVE